MSTTSEMTPLGALVKAILRDLILESAEAPVPNGTPVRRTRRVVRANGTGRGKRKLSAAGRLAIQRAVKARWAKYRKENKGK